MNSRQEKLKYGEILRQQMKERQEMKKMEKMEKRGESVRKLNNENIAINQPNQPENSFNDKKRSNSVMEKEPFQRQIESNQYNPYGKNSGGAPNRFTEQQRLIQNAYENGDNQNNGRGTPDLFNQRNNNFQPIQQQPIQNYNNYKNGNGYANLQQIVPPTHEYYQQRSSNPDYFTPNYNPLLINELQSYAPPAPYGFNNNLQLGGPSYQPNYPQIPKNNQMLSYENQKNDMKPNNQYIQSEKHQQKNQKVQINEQEIFRNGGRNLLKLENLSVDKILEEQNKKQRLQRQLKQQIEIAARKKDQEKQRIRRLELEEERKNKQYLERERARFLEEEDKKNKNFQNVNAQNSKNAQNKKEVETGENKKQKYQKIRDEVIKREKQQEISRQILSEKQKQKQIYQQRNERDETSSVASNDTSNSKGFNTAISRQFFKKERDKNFPNNQKVDKKIEIFTEEMQKMRNEISHQGQIFQYEIKKYKNEALNLKQQKHEADVEIQKLKNELKKRIQNDNVKFVQNLYGGKPNKDIYYADEVQVEQNKPLLSLKPKVNQKLITKIYEPSPQERKEYEDTHQRKEYNENTHQMEDSQLMSLDGDSKKIPVDLETSQQISISRLADYAKDTGFFLKKKNNVPNSPAKYINEQQSIKEEEDEQRIQSRDSNRIRNQQNYQRQHEEQDTLDKLVNSRKKSRGGWGEMSSVNEDVTNQIQNLLAKRKEQRPKSHLSSVGEQTLTNPNMKYQKSINNAYNHSKKPFLEVERPADLETVNSEGDLARLDTLLNKYK